MAKLYGLGHAAASLVVVSSALWLLGSLNLEAITFSVAFMALWDANTASFRTKP